MGYGAYMKISNNRSTPIFTEVSNVTCIYDNGTEGSNISQFNNFQVAPGTTSPTAPNMRGQYIEAINSGSCFFSQSQFTLSILNPDGTQLSTVAFFDNSGSWKNPVISNPAVVSVNVTDDWNSSGQGEIWIVVSPGPGGN